MFQVNNNDTRTTLLIRSGIFIVNFEHIKYFTHSYFIKSLLSVAYFAIANLVRLWISVCC